MSTDPTIVVELAFALPERQEIMELQVKKGCTAEEAIEQSGIKEKFSEIAFDDLARGIFSRPLNGVVLPLAQDYVLENADRIEFYRPLEKDPKQARIDRAKKVLMEEQRQAPQKKNRNKEVKKK